MVSGKASSHSKKILQLLLGIKGSAGWLRLAQKVAFKWCVSEHQKGYPACRICFSGKLRMWISWSISVKTKVVHFYNYFQHNSNIYCAKHVWNRLKCVLKLALTTPCLKNVPPLACYKFDTHERILIFFGRNVGNQKTPYYATSNNLCFCTTWQNGETRKSHFHCVGLCYTHNALVCCFHERKSCHLWCVWWRRKFVEIVRYPNNTVHWLSLQAWRRTTPTCYTATDTITDLVNTEHVGNRQQDVMLPSYKNLGPVWCTQSIVLTVKGGSALTRWYF